MALVIRKFQEGAEITPSKEKSDSQEKLEEQKDTVKVDNDTYTPLVTSAVKTPVPDYTIHYGDNEYDPAWVRDYVEKNINTFINNENMTLGQAEKFREIVQNVILPGIDAKTLDFSDPYTLKVPQEYSSDGYYNRTTGLFSHDITDDNKAGMIAATRYLRSLLSSPQAVPKLPKEAYNGDKVLIKALAEKLGNGNAQAFKSVWSSYTFDERKKALQNVLSSLDYDNIYKLYDFKDTNTKDPNALREAIANLNLALNAKELNSLTYTAAGKVGLSMLKSLLNGEEKKKETTTNTLGQNNNTLQIDEATWKKAAYDQLKALNPNATEEQLLQAVNQAWQEYQGTLNGGNSNSSYNTNNPLSEEGQSAIAELVYSDPDKVLEVKVNKKWHRPGDIELNEKSETAWMGSDFADTINKLKEEGKYSAYIEDVNNRIFKGLINGKYTLTAADDEKLQVYYYTLQLKYPNLDRVVAYYDEDSGKVIVANLNNAKDPTFTIGGIGIDEMGRTDEGKEAADKILRKYGSSYEAYMNAQRIPLSKYGSKLKRKLLKGGQVDSYTQTINLGIKDDFKKLVELNKAKGNDRWEALNQLMIGELGFDPDADFYLRLASAVQDLAGFCASFAVGGGTVVAGVTGITSMLTDFAADWMDDKVSAGDMWKNAGINLGLATIGLIPGGKAASLGGKIGKLLPTVIKGLLYAAKYGVGYGLGIQSAVMDGWKILNKADTVGWSNLTKEDWTAILRVFQTAMGLGSGYNMSRSRNKPFKVEEGSPSTTSTGRDILIKGKFVDNLGKKLKYLTLSHDDPKHKPIIDKLKDRNLTNKDRNYLLKNSGIVKEAEVASGHNWRFKPTGYMKGTERQRVLSWDDYKAANGNDSYSFKWGNRTKLRGYLAELRRQNPEQFLMAMKEIRGSRAGKNKIMNNLNTAMDNLAFKISNSSLARRIYGKPVTLPNTIQTVNGPTTASNVTTVNTLTSSSVTPSVSPANVPPSLWQQGSLFKQGGILKEHVNFAQEVLFAQKGTKNRRRAKKTSTSKKNTTPSIFDYNDIFNNEEYRKAWQTVLDELDKNPESTILQDLTDLLKSWQENSSTLFGNNGFLGVAKSGKGKVKARREIFNNTALGKAINTIIKANDGIDDYFGPLENNRHFGKVQHEENLTKLLNSIIDEGKKAGKYLNLKPIEIYDDDGMIGFRYKESTDLSGDANQSNTAVSVDTGTNLSKKSNKKLNISTPQLIADYRLHNALATESKMNERYHDLKVSLDDPEHYSYLYNDEYAPIKYAEKLIGQNLSRAANANMSSDPSINNASLLETMRLGNEELDRMRILTDANIRETAEKNKAIADTNANAAIKTSNENNEKLVALNNKFIDIDNADTQAKYKSIDRYLAQREQMDSQKIAMKNAIDYQLYLNWANALAFGEYSDLRDKAAKDLTAVADKLKNAGLTQEQVYNDPRYTSLYHSYERQMQELIYKNKAKGANYLASTISLNPYIYISPDNLNIPTGYIPSSSVTSPSNTNVTFVGKEGGKVTYSLDKAKLAYLKFLRDDYKLVSKRNAKVLHGEYK